MWPKIAHKHKLNATGTTNRAFDRTVTHLPGGSNPLCLLYIRGFPLSTIMATGVTVKCHELKQHSWTNSQWTEAKVQLKRDSYYCGGFVNNILYNNCFL